MHHVDVLDGVFWVLSGVVVAVVEVVVAGSFCSTSSPVHGSVGFGLESTRQIST